MALTHAMHPKPSDVLAVLLAMACAMPLGCSKHAVPASEDDAHSSHSAPPAPGGTRGANPVAVAQAETAPPIAEIRVTVAQGQDPGSVLLNGLPMTALAKVTETEFPSWDIKPLGQALDKLRQERHSDPAHGQMEDSSGRRVRIVADPGVPFGQLKMVLATVGRHKFVEPQILMAGAKVAIEVDQVLPVRIFAPPLACSKYLAHWAFQPTSLAGRTELWGPHDTSPEGLVLAKLTPLELQSTLAADPVCAKLGRVGVPVDAAVMTNGDVFARFGTGQAELLDHDPKLASLVAEKVQAATAAGVAIRPSLAAEDTTTLGTLWPIAGALEAALGPPRPGRQNLRVQDINLLRVQGFDALIKRLAVQVK